MEVYKMHVSGPGLLHLSRQFQEMTEQFENTASDWPRHFCTSYTKLFVHPVPSSVENDFKSLMKGQ